MFPKAIQSALLGLVAGGLAFAISLLFTHNAVLQPDAISFADWASRGTLSALICATVAAIITFDQIGPAESLRAFIVGLLVGAAAGAGAEVLYELILIKMGAGSMRDEEFGAILSTPMTCAAMGAAIFLACGPNSYRLKRCGVATGTSIIALLIVVERLHRWRVIASFATMNSRESGVLHPNVHLLEFLLVGAVVAFAFSLVESTLQPPSLRQILGQRHWKTWPLIRNRYLIGNGPNADIQVVGHPAIGAQQAQIVRQGDRFQIIDLSEGMTVNNLPAKQHSLLPGDIIRFDDVVFVYGIYAGRGSTGDTLHLPMASTVQHRLVDGFGNVFMLRPGPAVIGRDKSADIPIPWDGHASRQHAKVDLVANEVFLSDLGSKNGTKIEGTSISQPVRILPGNRFQVGSTDFTYLS